MVDRSLESALSESTRDSESVTDSDQESKNQTPSDSKRLKERKRLKELRKMGVLFKDRVMLFLVIASGASVVIHTLAALRSTPGAVDRFSQMVKGSVPVTLFFMAAQYLTRMVMNKVGQKLIQHGAGMSKTVYDAKVDRFGAACFKASYWTWSTIWAYIILRDEDWMPFELGGAGKAAAVWEGYGYQQHSTNLIW